MEKAKDVETDKNRRIDFLIVPKTNQLQASPAKGREAIKPKAGKAQDMC